MKLAEALIERASLQNRIVELRGRLRQVQFVQEGDTPATDPKVLLNELHESWIRVTELVKAINKTNSVTAFDPHRTITDAIADRDEAAARHRALREIADESGSGVGMRQTRSEIRLVATVNSAEMQRIADDAARRYREIDTKLQALNWSTDLIR